MVDKNKNTKKWLLLASVVVLSTVGTGVFFWQNRGDYRADTNEGVNLQPATEQEKQEAEANKDRIAADITKNKVENQQQNGSSTTNKNVTITFVGQYGDKIELSAFVSGVFEDGGTCKATFTKGGHTVVKETAGFKDVSRTSCTPFSIPRNEFSEAGTWAVKVSYNSATASGESSERTLEIK